MHAESATFRAEWEMAEANEVKKLIDRKFSNKLRIGASKRAGCRVSRFFWYIRLGGWLLWFKFPPRILGYRTTRIRDEMSATMMEGVIVKPSAGRFLHEMIVIEKWSDQCQILHEEVIGEDTRLREKQPLEAFNEINKRELNKQVAEP